MGGAATGGTVGHLPSEPATRWFQQSGTSDGTPRIHLIAFSRGEDDACPVRTWSRRPSGGACEKVDKAAAGQPAAGQPAALSVDAR